MKVREVNLQKSTMKKIRRGQTKSVSGFEKYLVDKKDYIEEIKSILGYNVENWERMASVVPAGTKLDALLQSFKSETDIPLELPLFSYFHFLSGYLLKNNVSYFGENVGSAKPFLWTIVLANSGAGKSFSVHKVEKASKVLNNFPEPASGAMFFEQLGTNLQNDNYCLWFLDECAQWLKSAQQMGSPLFDAKNYLLKIYGGERVERSTKKNGAQVIEKPAMTILGMNTIESFLNSITQESLTDGFAQRFSYCIAQNDDERPAYDYPIYSYANMKEAVEQSFSHINEEELKDKVFKITPECETAFMLGFKKLFTDKVPLSFFRRNLFRAFTYAVLYHLILEKTNDEIDAQDMAWALRMTRLHLDDMKLILDKDGLNEVKHKIGQVQALSERFNKAGKKLNPSQITQYVRGVSGKSEALSIMKLAGVVENN